ncbi:MAG: dTDP-4-dehydrorhamnose reductase [Acidimicrobiia bacterium]|nr:dTDP-4-dehydrorhamnose reductase [Acidimicrobiia bacterium]
MIVIIGKGGQLGSSFASMLGPGGRSLGVDELDLRDFDEIAPVLDRFRPSAVINCAGHTAVDLAEQQAELAYLLNATAVGHMARWAASRSVAFVNFSSDYVFDGTKRTPYVESDEANPINAYGNSKLAGEMEGFAEYPDMLLIRSSWMVSGSSPNFVATVLRRARQGAIRVVNDQVGVPNIADDLAVATLEALDAGLTGIFHLSSSGPTTWFDLARRAVELADMDPELVQPISTEEYGAGAMRPAYGVLASERETGIELPSWERSLPAAVKEMLTWI